MTFAPLATGPRNPPPSPVPEGDGGWPRVVGTHRGQATANRGRHRFDRALGFWLGGVLWGAGGCLVGLALPHERPVGVAVSALWWGTYLGCFGASIGALFGLLAEHLRLLHLRGSSLGGPVREDRS